MSTFNILNLSAATVVTMVLGYTAYWAFSVRRALTIRVYRNQALGIGLMASILGLEGIVNTASAYLISKDPLAAVGNGGFGLFFVFLVVLFYWTDASVLAARRSDAWSRDTLRWRIVRIPLWIGVLPAPLLVIPFDIYSLIKATVVSSSPPAWTGAILIPGIFIPPIAATLLLPIIGRRTRDPQLRRHLKWFGIFAATFLAFLFLENQPDIPLGLFWSYVGSIVGSYCLYRSVISLTPLKTSDS